MPRTFWTSLIISVFLVGAAAGSIAWVLSAWLPFLMTFVIAFLGIFAGFFLNNSRKERQIESDQLEIYGKADLLDHRNTVVIECPCKNNSFEMQVYPNELNSYTCGVCNNKFNLDLRIEPVLQTEPVNLDNAYAVFKALSERGEDAADSDEARKLFEKLGGTEHVYTDNVGDTL